MLDKIFSGFTKRFSIGKDQLFVVSLLIPWVDQIIENPKLGLKENWIRIFDHVNVY